MLGVSTLFIIFAASFEEMQYSQGLHGTDETTKRTEK